MSVALFMLAFMGTLVGLYGAGIVFAVRRAQRDAETRGVLSAPDGQLMMLEEGRGRRAHYEVSRTMVSLPEGKIGVALVDIAGLGLPAVLLSVSVRAAIGVLTPETPFIDIPAAVNRFLTRSSLGQRFATAFLAEIDPSTRTITSINAGYPSPTIMGRPSQT